MEQGREMVLLTKSNMKKRVFAVAVSLMAAVSSASGLLEGVSSIDVGGGALPGGYILIGTNSFALAKCRISEGVYACAAAGANYGEGRAVYLSHPSFLDVRSHRDDSSRFLRNAIDWTAKGKADAVIGVLRSKRTADGIRSLGFADVRELSAASELKGCDILLANDARSDEVAPILAFVREGGGYICGALGWGFLYYKPQAVFAEEFAPNRIAAEMGVLMNSRSVSRINGTFPAVKDGKIAGANAEEAVDSLLRGEAASKEEIVRAGAVALVLVDALPSRAAAGLHEKLDRLCNLPSAKKTPSPASAVRSEDAAARVAIVKRKLDWLKNPENPVAADESAAVYPGAVRKGTPKISKTVSVDMSVPRWHSTGVFAVAGEPLTVTLPDEALKLALKVRIGSTADDLTPLGEWRRSPMVTCEVPLSKKSTTVFNPFGGLVYIVVPDNAGFSGTVEVGISGGVMAPWFRKGFGGKAQFAAECRDTGAPYGEIQGKDFVVIAEVESLKKVDDPEWIADYWDKVLEASADLAQWEKRRYPERICSDVQLVAGFMHSGYPLMTHINSERLDWAVDKVRLEKGESWGCYHEIGHNHQNRDWTPDGTGEVTVNLFTLYAIESVAGADVREERFYTGTGRSAGRVKNWVSKGKRFEDWKRDPFLALEMYLRIKEAYGWEVYKKTFARYRERGFARPRNDHERWQIFAREMSKTANVNLAAVMAAWSLPISESTLKECSKYKTADTALFP